MTSATNPVPTFFANTANQRVTTNRITTLTAIAAFNNVSDLRVVASGFTFDATRFAAEGIARELGFDIYSIGAGRWMARRAIHREKGRPLGDLTPRGPAWI